MSSRPFAQRRQVDFDDAQPVEQIAAKAARGRLDPQIAVGRGDHMDVHLPGFERTDALHFAVLDGAEQLGLQRQRQLADFVQKERPAIGVLEQPDLRFRRPGERAAHVAEQLRFRTAFRRPPNS